MTDSHLQQRAGQNVGVENAGGYSIDKAAQNKFEVVGTSEVTVVEPSPNNNRLVPGKAPGMRFYGFNPTAVPFTFGGKFYNEFGESIDLVPSPAALPGAPGPTLVIFAALSSGQAFITLAKGEKVTLKGLTGTKGVFFVPTIDIKRKPKPSGGGGLSDGNVVTVRATLTSTGVEIGPPPGKAWGGAVFGGTADSSLPFRPGFNVGHFGAVADNPASVLEYLVDEAGQEYFLAGTVGIAPQSFKLIGTTLFGGSMGLLAYPNKWRVKLEAAGPQPKGRVMLLVTAQEYDLPADAQ
jgi:hypothetical protein